MGRRFLGIEREEEFAAISKARREEIENVKTFAKYRSKIADIVKAEDTQIDCFLCHESNFIERLPFLTDEPNDTNDEVLMYAVSPASRKRIESVGKLAIGIKDDVSKNVVFNHIGYIMFHYWNKETATPYQIVNKPRIVSKQAVPSGYLLRMVSGAQKFMLLEYDSTKPANIGNYDILKVQRNGKGRYMPFSTSLQSIIN